MKKSSLPWIYASLALIEIISFMLLTIRTQPVGYGNIQYAAAVKSMLVSKHNFFFASFDPGGFVSVDKPPLGLWIQAAVVFIFGFKNWSLLLPQVIAGVISVGLLYFLVRKAFGNIAGLLSAFTLAITPIFVAVCRTNELDPLLIMILLFAAYAINIAAEKGALGWLTLAMILVAFGFNIKMLEAYMVLPAFYVVYSISSALKTEKKIIHHIFATIVLLTVSFSWALIVDSTPAKSRPYIGSSRHNSVMNLVFNNTSVKRQMKQDPNIAVKAAEDGKLDLFQIFNKKLAVQIGWLLPIALLGIIIPLLRHSKLSLHQKSPAKQAIIFWGLWVLSVLIYFCKTGFSYRYYLSILAPGIAALTGIGMVQLWKSYRDGGWVKWILPVAILVNSFQQIIILLGYSPWSAWIIPLISCLCFVSVGILIENKEENNPRNRLTLAGSAINDSKKQYTFKIATILGLAGLLIAPSIWSIMPVLKGNQIYRVFTEPELKTEISRQKKFGTLINYLISHKKTEQFLVAVHSPDTAAPIILKTGQPVMTMGGYTGKDDILTLKKLKNVVNKGKVRYFLISKTRSKKKNPLMWKLDCWIIKNSKRIPEKLWRGDLPHSKIRLYDVHVAPAL